MGKSVLAVNLAAALARTSGEPVVVLDLDLQFGDVAVMLRLQPLHTFTDAISAGDLLDETLLRSFLARHEKSGVYVLAAPTSPSEADQVDSAAMLRVLDLLRDMFAHVVDRYAASFQRGRAPGGGGKRPGGLRRRHGRAFGEKCPARVAGLRPAAAPVGQGRPPLEPGGLQSPPGAPRH